MADYAGAVAAIKQRMVDNWTTTQIVFQNDAPDAYNPADHPQDPWVYFEVIGNTSALRSMGTPGNHLWLYAGLIAAHVYVPVRSGIETAQAHAAAIGEIFRAQSLYAQANGSVVRTWAPRTDGGDSGADDGNWFVLTCRIPFEYLHRG